MGQEPPATRRDTKDIERDSCTRRQIPLLLRTARPGRPRFGTQWSRWSLPPSNARAGFREAAAVAVSDRGGLRGDGRGRRKVSSSRCLGCFASTSSRSSPAAG